MTTSNEPPSSLIYRFLDEKFVFRKLQIHEYFGNQKAPIFWTFRNSPYHTVEIEASSEACQLLDASAFENWNVFDKTDINFFCDELEIRNISTKPVLPRRKLKLSIADLINNSGLVKTIRFNPVLKKLIEEGRHKVTNVKPLPPMDIRRTEVDAKAGSIYYLCNDRNKPYLANPCYITEVIGHGSFRAMIFTNVSSDGIDTNKIPINGYGFTTVYAYELGLTPSQAVLQRQN